MGVFQKSCGFSSKATLEMSKWESLPWTVWFLLGTWRPLDGRAGVAQIAGSSPLPSPPQQRSGHITGRFPLLTFSSSHSSLSSAAECWRSTIAQTLETHAV